MNRLFSYGTLRLPAVQHELFGRAVAEEHDTLTGWRLDTIVLDDPTVVGLSGATAHRILHPGTPGDRIDGAALLLSDAELARADAYETDAYVRVEAVLASGERAFVYVAAT